jgi:GntR family transcriptional regulator
LSHSPLLFQITPSSGEPIYRQLIDQIQRMIASGQLKQADYLPSVRQLAVELEVNPMTISKAYGYLEEAGSLTRVRGKGMMVAQRASSQSIDDRLEVLRPLATNLMQQSKQLGLTQEQTLTWLSEQMKKELP